MFGATSQSEVFVRYCLSQKSCQGKLCKSNVACRLTVARAVHVPPCLDAVQHCNQWSCSGGKRADWCLLSFPTSLSAPHACPQVTKGPEEDESDWGRYYFLVAWIVPALWCLILPLATDMDMDRDPSCWIGFGKPQMLMEVFPISSAYLNMKGKGRPSCRSALGSSRLKSLSWWHPQLPRPTRDPKFGDSAYCQDLGRKTGFGFNPIQ